MTSAFHFMTQTGVLSTPYGGIVPDPIVLENTTVLVDGKYVEVTATSGSQQYMIVEPGDYPMTEDERHRRAGSIK